MGTGGRRNARFAAVAMTLATLASACDGGGSAPRPTRSPTPVQTATTPAARVLQQSAQAANRASFSATYRARQRRPASRATWRVWRTPHDLRVDVVTRRSRATLIVTPRAAYACRAARRDRTCFRVARNGGRIPAIFQPFALRLFSTDLGIIGNRPDDYTAVDRGRAPHRPGVPAATCFSVRAASGARSPRVTRGVYCLSESGVLTDVTYPTGNTVRLVSTTREGPGGKLFAPYSSPTPLPR